MLSEGGKRTVVRVSCAAALLVASLLLPACPASAVNLTTLASFNGSNGTNPMSDLIADAEGNLYGTTYYGGANNYGTVFRIDAGTHALTTLVTFNWSNGVCPYAGLMADAMGNLYGTTNSGGTNRYGTVFRVNAGTQNLTTLVAFNGFNESGPCGVLISDAAGNIYGTTQFGGSKDKGTVFRVAAGTNALTTLVTFNINNGGNPFGGLIADAAGNMYGTTSTGSASGDGTVFRLAVGTNALTKLVAFNDSNGRYPMAGLIADSAGNLYGTTSQGGTNERGTVFRVNAGTHALATLVLFDGSNGACPYGGLIADAAGNLYGTTSQGGANDMGTVFRIEAGTNQLTTLFTFNGINGKSPFAGLIADNAGNLYGTTHLGGPNDSGTVFELTNSGFVVPEPATLSLLVLGGLAVLRSRRQSIS